MIREDRDRIRIVLDAGFEEDGQGQSAAFGGRGPPAERDRRKIHGADHIPRERRRTEMNCVRPFTLRPVVFRTVNAFSCHHMRPSPMLAAWFGRSMEIDHQPMPGADSAMAS